MHRTCLTACAVLAAVALVAVPSAPAADEEKLLLVIRTGPEIKLSDIKGAVQNTLTVISATKNYKDIISGEPEVKQLTATDFNAYVRLESPDGPLVPVPSIKDKDNLIEVRQQPAAVPTWEFNLLGIAPRELTKLEVTFHDAPDKPETFTPTTKRDDPLTLTQFGSYVLKPPSKPASTDPKAPKEELYRQPVKYTAHVRALGETAVKPISGEWPKGDNFYLIRLNGFKGDRKELARVIKDPKAIGGTALEAFKINTGVTLAIGEAGATDDEQEDDVIEGNKLYVSVPQLRRNPVNRAYMYFPLTADEAAKKTAALNALGANEAVKAIRAEKPVPVGQAVVLTKNAKPQWIELPLVDLMNTERGLKPGSFGRVLTLISDKPADLTPEAFKDLYEKFPEAHRVVVYEFDNGVVQNAVFYKRTPNQKERTLANSGPMNVWALQLAKLSPKPKGDKQP